MARIPTCWSLLITLLSVPCVHAQPERLPASTSPGDSFGHALAYSYPYLFASAPGSDEEGRETGVVYAFVNTTAGWVRKGKIDPPDDVMHFGRALAASGSVLAVSALSRRLDGSGVVLLYERRGGQQWFLSQRLTLENPAVADNFGTAIALREEQLLVGAPGASDPGEARGIVVVYDRGRDGLWRSTTVLRSAMPNFRGRFGSAIAYDGEQAVVGAPRERGRSTDTGVSYVFRRDGAAWSLVARLSDPDGEPGDAFGSSVAVYQDRVAVGAPHVAGKATRAGKAYLYSCSDSDINGCELTSRLETSDQSVADGFGATVVLRNTLLLIGAPRDDGLGHATGALYVFVSSGSGPPDWHRTGIFRLPSRNGGDVFGSAVVFNDGALSVAAPGANSTSGAVYVYSERDIVTPPRLSFKRVAHPQDGLKGHQAEALLQDDWGFLWIGKGEGLHRFDGSEYAHYQHDPQDSTSLSDNAVLTLLQDRDARMWVGTEDGINRFDRRQNRFVRYQLASDSTYPRQSIRAIFEDRQGRLWTGTNGRLYIFNPDLDRFEVFEAFDDVAKRLDETYVSGIQQDADGLIWVLAKNLWEVRSSLYRIDPRESRIDRYPISKEWGQVGPLFIDSRNDLWIKAPSPVALPDEASTVIQPDLAPLGVAHWTFFEDKKGTVWIGTAAGLHRYRDGVFESYQIVPAALHGPNFIRSIYETPSGQIFVGTNDGLYLCVDNGETDATDSSVLQVPLVLTDVHVEGPDGTVRYNSHELKSLRLSYRDNNVRLKFAALAFGRARPFRYVHRLQGVDGGWVESGPTRVAAYAKLPPGQYLFEARAVDDANDTIGSALALPIVITPPLWQTWWFRLLGAGVFIYVLLAAHRVRVHRLLAVERLRTRIASDLHDDVSSNLSGIAFVTEFVGQQSEMGSYERSQLAQVATTARGMVEDLRDIVWFIDPARDRFEELLLRMKDSASVLLNRAEVEFRIEEGADPGHLDMEPRRHIFLIYKEALHNIARHANAGHVTIEVAAQRRRFQMRIRDDGVGFDPACNGGGQGLRSMRRRAAALGGTLEVESRPGVGTQVSVSAEIPRTGDGRSLRGRLS